MTMRSQNHARPEGAGFTLIEVLILSLIHISEPTRPY